MRYYLSCAIDYVNSRPHLGTAYEKMTADIIARYRRATGCDVLFLMGNDEHSVKVATAAKEQGLTPLAYCDKMELEFRDAWRALDVEPTDFIRTTEERHKTAVREVVNRVHARGDLIKGRYAGWYCVGCEAFKREDELVGGKCPAHLTRTPEWLEEENWFFDLPKYQQKLLDHYAAHPDFVRPESRRNELLAVLEKGLERVSVSRSSVDWGVPFPFDERSVVYVWFDALINYVAATGWPSDAARSAKWWPADVHLVGKDITRFHAIIWPAMLLSAGLPLPKLVFGHGFVNLGGDRMSKSSGNSADPQSLAKTYGPDALRYFVAAEASFGQDLDFTEARLRTRINSDLANSLGNLASRTASMLGKYRSGIAGPCPNSSPLLAEMRALVPIYRRQMDDLDLRGGASTAMSIVTKANAHVDRTQPFTLAKDPAKAEDLRVVLAELANAILLAGTLLYPFMPRKMTDLCRQYCGAAPDPARALLDPAKIEVPADFVIEKGHPLFPRLEDLAQP